MNELMQDKLNDFYSVLNNKDFSMDIQAHNTLAFFVKTEESKQAALVIKFKFNSDNRLIAVIETNNKVDFNELLLYITEEMISFFEEKVFIQFKNSNIDDALLKEISKKLNLVAVAGFSNLLSGCLFGYDYDNRSEYGFRCYMSKNNASKYKKISIDMNKLLKQPKEHLPRFSLKHSAGYSKAGLIAEIKISNKTYRVEITKNNSESILFKMKDYNEHGIYTEKNLFEKTVLIEGVLENIKSTVAAIETEIELYNLVNLNYRDTAVFFYNDLKYKLKNHKEIVSPAIPVDEQLRYFDRIDGFLNLRNILNHLTKFFEQHSSEFNLNIQEQDIKVRFLESIESLLVLSSEKIIVIFEDYTDEGKDIKFKIFDSLDEIEDFKKEQFIKRLEYEGNLPFITF